MSTPKNPLTLAHWRRTVADMYEQVRQTAVPEQAWQTFLQQKNELFHHHADTPFDADQLANFNGLPYYDYNPAYRVLADIDWEVERVNYCVELEGDGRFSYTRIANSISLFKLYPPTSVYFGLMGTVAVFFCRSGTRPAAKRRMVAVVICTTASKVPI